jgi:hypothetical protein
VNVSATDILLYGAIAVLVFYKVIYSQLKGTMLSVKGLVATPLILLALGAYFTVQVLPQASTGEIVMLLADLGILLALGAARNATTKLSSVNGYAFQKGNALTLVLWLVTMGVRVGFLLLGDAIGVTGPLTSASICLTIGASIGMQNLLTYTRVQRSGLRLATDRRQLAATNR